MFTEGFEKLAGKDRGRGLLKAQMRKIDFNNSHPDATRSFKHIDPKAIISTQGKLTGTEKARQTASNLKSIQERSKGIRSASRGASFAMRHPIVTLGAGLLAGKMMFGQKDEPRQPAVVYPQQ